MFFFVAKNRIRNLATVTTAALKTHLRNWIEERYRNLQVGKLGGNKSHLKKSSCCLSIISKPFHRRKINVPPLQILRDWICFSHPFMFAPGNRQCWSHLFRNRTGFASKICLFDYMKSQPQAVTVRYVFAALAWMKALVDKMECGVGGEQFGTYYYILPTLG